MINSEIPLPVYSEKMLEYRKEAGKTIEILKRYDYDADAFKGFLSVEEKNIISLHELLKRIPENKKELINYSSINRISGLSAIQNIYTYREIEVYVTESTQYSCIVGKLLDASIDPIYSKFFNAGSGKIKELIFEIFGKLYPHSPNEGVNNLDNVLNHIRQHYKLIIFKNEEGNFMKIAIPIYRIENENEEHKKKEFSGGLLHILQHYTNMKKPISSINKTQKGNTQFTETIFMSEILDGFEHMGRTKLDFYCKINFEFVTNSGVKKTMSLYYNKIANVFFINSLRSI